MKMLSLFDWFQNLAPQISTNQNKTSRKIQRDYLALVFPRLEMVANRLSRHSDFIGSFKCPQLLWLDDVWFLIFNIQSYQS